MSKLSDAYWPRLLRTLRAREGLSQAELAARLAVDQTTVSRWERAEDLPSLARRRRIRDLYTAASASRQDRAVLARVRHAAWPATLVERGAVFLEINRSAAEEARLSEDLRGRSIYGRFGPETDAVTERWERTGIFQGDLALTMSLNVLGAEAGEPVYLRTLDTPHFTGDGDVWCVCEIKRIAEADYGRLRAEFGGPNFAIAFDDWPM